MKKLLVVALPLGLAILGGAALLSSQRARQETFDARLERARVKREFAERAAAARAIAPDRAPEWRDEVTALSRWYFDELQAIRNRYPGAAKAPSAVALTEDERKGKVAEKDRAMLDDFQRYADGRLALLREAKYAPVASAVDAGLRLDLLAVESAKSPEGGPGLRIDFALWGAPRLVARERSGDKVVTRTLVPVTLKRIGFRFADGAGKPYGEMNGSGEPYQKLTDPERFVEDFPPGVLFGTWWVELMPREGATVELAVEADVRGAAGSSHPATFHYKLPVPESWKLPPGATFAADVREEAPAAVPTARR
jgi:hypothetical protein